MRITNSMITQNSKRNINKTKEETARLNEQMTSQKKIEKPSDNPVIAIRSLRLRNSQSQINQYYKNNIPDAESWLTNTETALKNIKIAINDVYVQCVDGADDVLDISGRRIILESLSSLREDIYSEGNAEYSGRTLFTGFKTGSTLCFMEDETDTTYQISQRFSYTEMESYRYYSNQIEIPDSLTGYDGDDYPDQTAQVDQYRVRLAYNGIDDLQADGKLKSGEEMTLTLTTKDADGNDVILDNITPVIKSYADWQENGDGANGGFSIGANEVYVIKETGEMIFGEDIAKTIKTQKPDISITYDKTGFKKGEVKPEYYYDCTNESDLDPAAWVNYQKQDQQIKYTIANNTTLTVNIQAGDIYNTDIGRDIDEMISACDLAIKAQEKVTKIESMIESTEYANDEDAQAYLANLLEAAQREQSFLEDNMQKLFSQSIENFQGYLQDTSNCITDVGNKMTQLELVESRMSASASDMKTLISSNEDEDLSEIVINYTAAYNAYEASLMAASKASQKSLLDYL